MITETWLRQIAEQESFVVRQVHAVHGGDINAAYQLDTDKGAFFLKLNDARRFPEMFALEANGLIFMQQHFQLKVPAVISSGEVGQQQYLLLEWLQPATPTTKSWEAFGQALASMHQQASNHLFGFEKDNYLRSIRMHNAWQKDWPTFYQTQRLEPLVKMLRDGDRFSEKDVQLAEQFYKRLPTLISNEPPALLHGDLWSGNAMAVKENENVTIAIYDPSVYFGHREIDIAMTRLFGGFPRAFYDGYESIYPLQKGWQQRLPIFQLSHLLLHAVLFGGGYVSSCREIIRNG